MISVDGTSYDVRIRYETMQRAFEIIEGRNAGTAINGRKIRDIIGTGYTYKMDIEPNPASPADYDSLYEVLSAPVDYHTVTLPYGQSTITFDARVISGDDIYKGLLGSKKRWTGLSITFEYMQPQRTPT